MDINSKNNQYIQNEGLATDLKHQAIRGAGFALFSRTINYFIAIGGTVVLARILTPDDFGLVTMVTTITLLLGNFGTNGFPEAIIKEHELSHAMVSNLFWIHIGTNFLLILVFLALTPLIVWFYGEERIRPIIYMMSISIIIPCFSAHHLALLRRNMMFARFAGNEIAATFLSSSLGIMLAAGGFGYWAIVFRRMSVSFFSAIGAWMLCGWRPSLPNFQVNVSKMFNYALHTYGSFVTAYFTRNMDKLLIARFHGSVPLANYDRAYHIFLVPTNQLTGTLNNVALPVLSRLVGERERYIKYFLKSIAHMSFIGMFVSVVTVAIGKDLVLLLLGPKWDLAGELLQILGPAIGMTIVDRTNGWLHLSLGHADRWFRWGILSVFITFTLMLIGVPYGAKGVAAAYSLSLYLLMLPGLWYAGKPVQLSIMKVIGSIWRFFLSAVITGIICLYVLTFQTVTAHFFGELSLLLRLFATVLFCGIVYTSSVVIVFRSIKPITDPLQMIRELFQRAG